MVIELEEFGIVRNYKKRIIGMNIKTLEAMAKCIKEKLKSTKFAYHVIVKLGDIRGWI